MSGTDGGYARSRVSIVRCDDYAPKNVSRAVRESVGLLGGAGRFVRPGNRVLIKPNLLAAHPPESAICTHPTAVEAIIRLFIEAGGLCTVGDSPCITAETPQGFRRMLEITGMQDMSLRTGVPILRFDDEGVERDAPDALVFRRLFLARALDDADVMVSVPKLKTHGLTLLSGALKNIYGCVPGRRKIEYHLQAGDSPEVFAQILIDIMRTVRPRLHIVDGITGMDGQGPSTGRKRDFSIVLASTDPVALDAVICMMAGIDSIKIPAIRMAAEQGIGVSHPDWIEIVGDQDVRIHDLQFPPRRGVEIGMPKPIRRMIRNHLTRHPVIRMDECMGCGVCMDACPAGAISGPNDSPHVNHSQCISCYCCQEVCPQGAILLRDSRFRGILESVLDLKRKTRSLLRPRKHDQVTGNRR